VRVRSLQSRRIANWGTLASAGGTNFILILALLLHPTWRLVFKPGGFLMCGRLEGAS
jgi:hypothetical protein